MKLELLKEMLLDAAKDLHEQGKAIEDAVVALAVPEGLTDEQHDAVLKLMLCSTVGAIELIKTKLLTPEAH